MAQHEDIADRLHRVRKFIRTENAKMPIVDNFGRPIETDDDAGEGDQSDDDPEPPQRRGPAPDRSQGVGRPRVEQDTSAVARSTRAVFLAANTGMSFAAAMRRLGEQYR